MKFNKKVRLLIIKTKMNFKKMKMNKIINMKKIFRKIYQINKVRLII